MTDQTRAAREVKRTRWVDYGREGYARLPEDATDCTGEGVVITVDASDYDAQTVELNRAKDLLQRGRFGFETQQNGGRLQWVEEVAAFLKGEKSDDDQRGRG